MGKGLPRSLGRTGAKPVVMKRETYRIGGTVPNIDGASGIGWGTLVVGDLPEGNILVVGALLQCTLTEASANIIATFAGNVSVGSAPTADSTLSAGEVDIIPSTAYLAVTSVATVRAVSTASIGGVILDNTDNSLELNVNVLVADASIDADDQTLAISGTLILIYTILGDD